MDAGNRNQQSQREKFPTERQRPLPVFEHEEESSHPDVQSSSKGRHNLFTFQPSFKRRYSSSALQPSSEIRRYSSSTHQPTNSTRKRKNDNKIHPAIEIYADTDLRCTQSTLKDVHKTDSKMYTKQTQRCIQNSRDDIHKAGSTM